MNKIFKVIWNHATQSWVATSELTKAKGKTKSTTIAAALLSALVGSNAMAAEAVNVGSTQASSSGSAVYVTTATSQGINLASKDESTGTTQVTTINSGLQYTLVGKDAETFLAAGGQGVAIGTNASLGKADVANQLAGFNSTVIGTNVASASNNSVVLGTDAISGVSPYSSLASDVATNVNEAVLYKWRVNNTVIGQNVSAASGYNVVIGSDSVSKSGEGNVVLGLGASVDPGNVDQANTKNESAIAIGTNASSKSYGASAIGLNANATSPYAIAYGTNATSDGSNGIALGADAKATQDNAIATGKNANASGWASTATGLDTTATNFGATATGARTDATGYASSAYGYNSTASGESSIAVGRQANATAFGATTIGSYSNATGTNSTAIGTYNNVTTANSSTLGTQNDVLGDNAVAIGLNNTIAATADNTVVLGNNITATDANAVILGNNSSGSARTSNIGNVGVSGNNGNSYTYNYNSKDFAGNSGTLGYVSVGAPGAEREIQNVAAGEVSASSTDAINGSQLFAVMKRVETANWTIGQTGGTNVAQIAASNRVNFDNGTLTVATVKAQPNGANVTYNVVTQNITSTGGKAALNGNSNTGGVAGTTSNGNALTTANDVINAINNSGWNLQSNGSPVGLINPADTVNFKSTDSTVTITPTAEAGGVSTLDFKVNVGSGLKVENGKVVANGTTITAGNDNVTIAGDAINGYTISAKDTNTQATVTQKTGSPITVSEGTANSNGTKNYQVDVSLGDGLKVEGGKLVANGTTITAGGNVTVTGNPTDGYTVSAKDTQASVAGGTGITVSSTDNANGTKNYTVAVSTANLATNNGAVTAPSTEDGSKVVNATTVANAINNSGWNLAADGTTGTELISPSETATFAAGTNLEVSRSGSTITYKTKDDVTFSSVSITGGPTLNADGINMNGDTITNLGNGTNASDAVNLSQLKANTSKVVGAGIANVTSTSNADGTTYTVNVPTVAATVTRGSVTIADTAAGANGTMTANDIAAAITNSEKTSSVEAGSNAVTVAAGTEDAAGNTKYTVDLSADTKAQLAKEESVSAGNNNVKVVANGTNSTGGKDYQVTLNNTVDLTSAGSVTIGGTTINNDGLTITNGPSVTTGGINAGDKKITNVANGTISSTSTDAVNGSQLYAEAAKAKTEVTGSGLATVTNKTGTNGQTIYNVDVAKVAATVARGSVTIADAAAGANGTMTANDIAAAITNSERTSSVTNGSTSIKVEAGAEDANGNTQYTVDLSDDAKAQLAKEESVSAGNTNVEVVANGTNATGGKDYKVTLSNNVTLASNGSVTIGDTKITNDGLTITNGPSITSTGIDAGDLKVTNVANGTISADSKDAVNGSQLYDTIYNKGFSLTAEDGNSVKKALGESIEVVGKDDNISTEVEDGKVKIALNNNITLASNGSVTIGGTTINNDGLTITNGPSITTNGIDAGNKTITNVANGTNATDAVNLSQLNASSAAAKTEVEATGLATVTNRTGANNQTIYTVDVAKADAPTVERGSVTVAAGDENKVMTAGDVAAAITGSEKTSSVTNGSTSIKVEAGAEDANGNTQYTVDLSDEAKAQIAKEETVKAGSNTVVTEGVNSTGGKEFTVSLANNVTLASNGSVTIGDTVINNDGLTITGGPSVTKDGINAGDQKITNVSNGTISANSTDAVNGSQLYSVANSITNVLGNGTLSFAGNKGDVITKKLDETLAIKGGLATDADASSTNVRVDSENGELVIKISDNPDFNTVNVGGANGTTTISTVAGKDFAANNNGTAQSDKAVSALSVGGNQITNVANGGISANSTDAVNGAQLYDVKSTVEKGWNISSNGQQVANVQLGDTVDFVDGKNTTANITTVNGKPTVTFDVKTASLTSSTTTTTNPDGTTTTTETGKVNVPADANSLITAQDVANAINNSGWNVAVKANGGEVGTNTGSSLVKAGSTATTVAGKNIKVSRSGSDVTIETVMNPEFNEVKITSTDGSSTTSLTSGRGTDATGAERNTLNVGTETNPTIIRGVAPGVQGTDAVNVNQLKGAVANINNKINNVDKDLRAGIAGATAAAGLQQVTLPGKSMVSAGVGTYRGQSALAVGYSRLSDSGRIGIKLSGHTNTRGDTGAAASVGFQW